MSDDEFLSAVLACTLAPAQFNHMGHVRVAWIHLQRYPFDEAVFRTCAAIKSYAAHLGATTKFHWTVREALMHLLHNGGAADRRLNWSAFIARNNDLLANARGHLARHYSDAMLEAGRESFVMPDRLPFQYA
jgi:hypothetical protein